LSPDAAATAARLAVPVAARPRLWFARSLAGSRFSGFRVWGTDEEEEQRGVGEMRMEEDE